MSDGPVAARPSLESLGQSIRRSVKQAKLLLVVDTPLAGRLLEGFLRLAGFGDVQVCRGGAALAEIEAIKPNLVVIEPQLLEADRIELCAELRSDPRFMNLPIIVLADQRDQADGPMLFEIRVSDVLFTPINPNELVTRVVKQLEHAEMVHTLRQYHDRTWQELAAARRMQLQLLPSEPIQHGMMRDHGLRIAAFYRPSSEIGGDIWGVLPISESSFGLFIADFAGHGVTAALNTFRLHALILELKAFHQDPSALLGKLNDRLTTMLTRGQFATFFYVVIDMARGGLQFASAGAPAPILRTGAAPADLLDSSGFPLGVVRGAVYERHEQSFPPGSTLMLFSDGLSEYPDDQGKRIGEDGLLKVIDGLAEGLDPEDVVESVRDAAGIDLKKPLPDDTMIVCVDRSAACNESMFTGACSSPGTGASPALAVA